MDPRRFLILAASGLLLSGCAVFRPAPAMSGITPMTAAIAAAEVVVDPPEAAPAVTNGAPALSASVVGTPYLSVTTPAAVEPLRTQAMTGRSAIAAANRQASAPSRSDAFVGGVQVFAWAPGRVYEVWTAPLRVTTLTLGAGETIVSKAAGDTVRWQIGDTTSGTGPGQRSHVLLKPLERGLETNLVLTTNRRVYLLDLRSGSADGFNAAVAWDQASLGDESMVEPSSDAVERGPVRVPDSIAMPVGALDARYRIEPQGRRARWTPTSVFNDGRRTFITFDADLQIDEAPALFVIAPDGEAQMVNYRQAGGLFVVDRVFDRAELRLGDRRPQIVRLQRLQGAS